MDEDQVSVDVFSKRTDVGSADKVTVGTGVVGVTGSLPPPPPPPPQETINEIQKVMESHLLANLI